MIDLQKESWNQFRTVAHHIATALFVAAAIVGLLVFLWSKSEPTLTRAYLMTYFIEHEESGAMYRIGRRVFRTRNECNAATAVLNRDRPTVWLEESPDAYILNYARCGLTPELLDRKARERLNEKLALKFIGG